MIPEGISTAHGLHVEPGYQHELLGKFTVSAPVLVGSAAKTGLIAEARLAARAAGGDLFVGSYALDYGERAFALQGVIIKADPKIGVKNLKTTPLPEAAQPKKASEI